MLIGIIKKLRGLDLDLNIELDDDDMLGAEVTDLDGNVVYSIETRDEYELIRCVLNYITEPSKYFNSALLEAEVVEV